MMARARTELAFCLCELADDRFHLVKRTARFGLSEETELGQTADLLGVGDKDKYVVAWGHICDNHVQSTVFVEIGKRRTG